MYDDTEEFINNQNILFEKESNNQPQIQTQQNQNNIVINPGPYNQIQNVVNEEPPVNLYTTENTENVFSNQSLEPDERQETIIEAKVQEQKTEQNPIFVDTSKPKVCPKCGTKLAPTATTCFLCGTKLL